MSKFMLRSIRFLSPRGSKETTSSRCSQEAESDNDVDGLAKNTKVETYYQPTDTPFLDVNAQTKEHAAALLSSVPGDLVELKNSMFSHWAVYLGDETVAYLTSDENDEMVEQVSSGSVSSSKRENASKIHLNSFFNVASNTQAEFNNILDNEKKPFPQNKIMERVAQSLLDKDLKFENSKQFATWCRYGDGTDTAINAWARNVLENITDLLHALRNIVLLIWHA